MQNHEPFLLDPDHERLTRSSRPRLLPRGQGCLLLFASIFCAGRSVLRRCGSSPVCQFVILSTNYAENGGQVLGRRTESDEGAT
jgi:hypothetical protein